MTKKSYLSFDSSDPNIRLSIKRGFYPITEDSYVDEVILNASDLKDIIVIPEIEELSSDLIEHYVRLFEQHFQENGNLSGRILQSIATWMLAWGLEMTWRWNNGNLDQIVFEQDMSSFDVPMAKFELIPQVWSNDIIMAFLEWSFNNPGYTNKYEIDIYDPIRDGYLTLIRCVVTKSLPHF